MEDGGWTIEWTIKIDSIEFEFDDNTILVQTTKHGFGWVL
jgi:hypothetical protein